MTDELTCKVGSKKDALWKSFCKNPLSILRSSLKKKHSPYRLTDGQKKFSHIAIEKASMAKLINII